MKKTIVFLLLITLFSCNFVMKKEDSKPDKPKVIIEKTGLPLNSQWILERFDNVDFKTNTKDSYITINDDLISFSGKGGCNNIGGSLVIKDNSIKFDKVFRTQIYCTEMMIQEDLFVNNLNETNKFKIIGGELFLYKDAELLMTLESFRN
jgi:heat shock protein HslJ